MAQTGQDLESMAIYATNALFAAARTTMRYKFALGVALTLVIASPVSAHHSASIFDLESVRDKKQKINGLYHEGLMYFHTQNWADAMRLFGECRKICPEDNVSRLVKS